MEVAVRSKSNSATFSSIRRNEIGGLITIEEKVLCNMIVSGETKDLFLDFCLLLESKLVSIFIDGHFTPANQVTLEEATSLGMSVILDGGKELTKTDGPVKNEQVCDAFEAAESIKPISAQEKLVWSNKDTSLMIQYYKDFMGDIGPMKKFKNKKSMWDFIGSNISRADWKINGCQCENRFKTVNKRKTKATAENNKSGGIRIDVPFEEELAEIQAVDDSMLPLVMRGQGRVEYPKNSSYGQKQQTTGGDRSNSSNNDSPTRISASKITRKRRPQANLEILQQIKMNQEAKQKRHEERSHHMEQLAADRRELIELKRREVALREEKNNMIRQLALNKNSNDPQDVFLYSNEH